MAVVFWFGKGKKRGSVILPTGSAAMTPNERYVNAPQHAGIHLRRRNHAVKLKSVTIHQYKCIESSQNISIEDDVTILVGMNESGKTSVLEAVAKTNYFQQDESFRFDATHDYPRREKKVLDKSGDNPDAVTCTYEIGTEARAAIEAELGKGVFDDDTFSVTTRYDNTRTIRVGTVNRRRFLENHTRAKGIHSRALVDKLLPVKTSSELEAVISEYKDEDKVTGLKSLRPFYPEITAWECPIKLHLAYSILLPMRPKFLYYDEYYSLPSRISIEKLKSNELEGEDQKTAKALFELADINITELLQSEEFEDFIAELEATEATITEVLFKYWTTNSNLDIVFRIDKRDETDRNGNRRIVEHVLDIRVKNTRARVSLPLRNRSKGFNWFFSFLVWFLKVQEDKDSSYVLLLDEPGLNLHAAAQADLLRFINDLSDRYQIVYTTHSPFMVQSDHLEKVRTVLETEKGTQVSDSVHEKDPKTLFPLQAALGYNIAQNLFISKNNLLVEGISDLVYLQVMSAVLEANGRTGLTDDVTVVPTGGLDKVATFISLLRGNELRIACLLDSFSDQKGKQKLDDMVRHKLIRDKQVRFAHEFVDGLERADIEDFFTEDEYLKMLVGALPEHTGLTLPATDDGARSIILRINRALGSKRFNHYLPANWLAKQGVEATFFSDTTLDTFENVFETINGMFARQGDA
jgi:predicted ATPase